MKILFLIFHGFSEHSGISKKIMAQIDALKHNGHYVDICTYIIDQNGHRQRLANGQVIADYGTGIAAKIKKRCCYKPVFKYAQQNKTELVYVRSFHNANPFTINLFKKLSEIGIGLVMEIPTYPYDPEYRGAGWDKHLNLWIDRMFRTSLAKYMKAIVTFSDKEEIFGKKTIRISNGVDFSRLPLRKNKKRLLDSLHLIGVAEVHYWHGYDRLIKGIGEYYITQPATQVFFHIVGGIADTEMYDSPQAPGFHELIEYYGIKKYVVLHGQKFGKELDELFDRCDIGIGSLGRHRSSIDKIKTLKNREYAARGIPFVYSETDSDFEGMPYILKIPADETPVDIKRITEFYRNMKMSPGQIRDTVSHLSWKEQMQKVIEEVNKL